MVDPEGVWRCPDCDTTIARGSFKTDKFWRRARSYHTESCTDTLARIELGIIAAEVVKRDNDLDNIMAQIGISGTFTDGQEDDLRNAFDELLDVLK